MKPLESAWPWIVRCLGIGIVLWQLLVDQLDRPYMLLFAAGCLGLPTVHNIAEAIVQMREK